MRTRLPWPWRVVSGLGLLAVIAGMWWWGFDFGQIFGGFNRKIVDAKFTSLETESAQLRAEVTELRARTSRLESELAMAHGSQKVLSYQAMELQNENSQLKEDLSFLQNLLADSKKPAAGVSIQRLAAARRHGDEFQFSMLVVRGGGSNADFHGSLKLQAMLFEPATDGAAFKPVTLTLPDEQPDTAGALELKFKYYQRVEGSFRVPPGATLRSLTARAFEDGQSKPQATQNLNFQ